MEQGQPTPNDPLYYAPRRLRERPEPPQAAELPSSSVYQTLPRSLDPEVMQEVTALARDHVDRRKALFGAAAIGVSALAALFVVLMVHASQEPDAGSSFAAALNSMKTVLPAPPPQQQQQQRVDGGSKSTLAEFRGLLTPADASQGAPQGQHEKVLQQFMQWRQKAGTGATSQ
jgi:hypothetical protein